MFHNSGEIICGQNKKEHFIMPVKSTESKECQFVQRFVMDLICKVLRYGSQFYLPPTRTISAFTR